MPSSETSRQPCSSIPWAHCKRSGRAKLSSSVGISSLPSLLHCLHRKETETQREVPWLSPSGTRGKHRFQGVSGYRSPGSSEERDTEIA